MAVRLGSRDVGTRMVEVTVFLAVIWGFYLYDTNQELIYSHGIVPRDTNALVGILAAPFLHASLLHISANTISLAVMLYQRAAAVFHDLWITTASMAVMANGLIWIVHPDTGGEPIVGASALACALFGHGIGLCLEEPFAWDSLLNWAVIGAQIYFLWDLWLIAFLPNDLGVSWVGHWCGIAVGLWVAFFRGTSI